MKKTLLFLILSFLYSCSIDKEKLKVINDIPLGITFDDLKYTKDKYDLDVKSYYSKSYFNLSETEEGTSDVKDKYITNFLTTDVFNFHEFGEMVHTGIVLPTTFEGTENIVEITVLLCFENNALLITPKELFNLSKVHKRKSVIQAVNTTFIEKVKRIITNKYGKPKSEEVPLFTSFPAFQDGKIEQFSSDPSQKIKEYTWETDYYDVVLSEGFTSNKYQYSNSFKTYTHTLADSLTDSDFKEDEVVCKMYPYIKYSLKDKIISKLGLDKAKL